MLPRTSNPITRAGAGAWAEAAEAVTSTARIERVRGTLVERLRQDEPERKVEGELHVERADLLAQPLLGGEEEALSEAAEGDVVHEPDVRLGPVALVGLEAAQVAELQVELPAHAR